MTLTVILTFGKLVGLKIEIFSSIEANVLHFSITENPNTPLLNLKPPSPIICLEYNPKDPTTLVSGFQSGQVGAWDTRSDKSLVAISEREVCHQEAVNSILWINSKTGTEFFSGSFDGRIIW